jgi:ribonuclease HI
MLDLAQNRNLRVITGQLALMPNETLRVEAGVQSFGCLRDRVAAVALEWLLKLDPATHPRTTNADSLVTRQFKGGTDGQSKGKEVVSRVGGGLDTLGRLPIPAPSSAPWEWRKGCWTVSLSLRGGSSPNDPPARKLADALDTIRHYRQLQTVVYTDGSAVGGIKRGGSSAVVTSDDPGNPTFLDVRHQCGTEYTTSLEIEMWGLWLALDCLDDEAVAAGVLICSDSHWDPNALTESGHSSHSVLAPLRACLRGLKGRVCFQWVPAHCSLLGNKRADEEARKVAGLGPDNGAQRGRVSFDVVKGLIGSQVKDGSPSRARTSQVYGDGPFLCLKGA